MRETSSLGSYELTARLGAGGMAEVWKAVASGPGGFARTVVVKRILPHLADDARFVAMFLSEARLSARLHHSSIVDVFACGDLDGRYFVAMEYVHGHDLHHLMRAHATQSRPLPGLAAFVMRDVCRALGYAHELTGDDGRPLGLVHCDVSPSNVMVSYDGAVKLLDFGIAKAFGELQDEHSRHHHLEGKRSYLAPEVLAGRSIDARADQYSAGVMMHELLTGSRLFGGLDPLTRPRVVPPSTVNPRVPPELDRICLKALEPDRERRFSSCVEMATALDRLAHQLEWGPQQVAELLAAPLARCAAHAGGPRDLDLVDLGAHVGRAADATADGERLSSGSVASRLVGGVGAGGGDHGWAGGAGGARRVGAPCLRRGSARRGAGGDAAGGRSCSSSGRSSSGRSSSGRSSSGRSSGGKAAAARCRVGVAHLQRRPDERGQRAAAFVFILAPAQQRGQASGGDARQPAQGRHAPVRSDRPLAALTLTGGSRLRSPRRCTGRAWCRRPRRSDAPPCRRDRRSS